MCESLIGTCTNFWQVNSKVDLSCKSLVNYCNSLVLYCTCMLLIFVIVCGVVEWGEYAGFYSVFFNIYIAFGDQIIKFVTSSLWATVCQEWSLVVCPFSCGNQSFHPSATFVTVCRLDYRFWLSFWYPQTLLCHLLIHRSTYFVNG
jgi:hypothetical protein